MSGTRTDAKIARLGRLLDVFYSGLANSDLLFYNGATQKWENKAGFATETNTGIGRIATQAEMNAGLLDNVFVTPLKVATYVNALVAGGVQFAGGYDANTNTPDLVTPAPGVVIQGDMYVVTVAGTFFGEALEIGDSLIATIDDPAALSDWIRVEKNVSLQDLASVLAQGNTTGANDIIVDSPQKVQFGAATEYISGNGAGVIRVDVASFLQVYFPSGSNALISDSLISFADFGTGGYSSMGANGTFIGIGGSTNKTMTVNPDQFRLEFDDGVAFTAFVVMPALTGNRVINLQDGNGTLAFIADILAKVLTGISFASSATITAADTILSALGKLQAQSTLNNVKVTNATHTGEVTGSGALTVDKTAISNRAAVTAVGSDYILIGDTSDSNNLKKALVSDLTGASSWLTTTVSPAQVVSNQNNYAPAGLAPKVMLRVDLDANRDFTGFDSTGFADRDYFLLANISTSNLKLKSNDANSLAANRIDVSADTTLNAGHTLILVRDATSARWRVTTNKP